jgi:hypothetical protein
MVKKTKSNQEGSALIATLLFVGLMLSLLLYFTVLVKVQSDTGSIQRSIHLSLSAVQTGIAQALAEIEASYLVPTNRVYSLPAQTRGWVSRGTGGAVTNLVEENTAEDLAWPEVLRGTGADSLVERASGAEWVILGDSNRVHTAVAWVGVDLTGLVDPNGVSELVDVDFLGVSRTGMVGKVFLSEREFAATYSNAVPVFVPGGYSMDQGVYDETTSLWQTNLTVGTETLPLNLPISEWTTNQVEAVFTEVHPDKDAAALTEAFLDFREGKELPTNPDGLTAVAVPMINEVTANVVVSNMGSQVSVSHEFRVEVWYPFPANAQTNRYRMPKTPSLVARNVESQGFQASARDSEADWEFQCPSGSVDGAFGQLILTMNGATSPMMEGQSLELDWNLGGLLLERVDGSGVVDRLPAGLALSYPAVAIPPSGGVSEVSITLEVEDPRINHEVDHWVIASTNSVMAINAAARAAQQIDEFRDGFICWVPDDSFWLTSDPLLALGHFPMGDPWTSVDLFSEEGRWWLRHTRPATHAFGEVETGPINANSLYPDGLAAAFNRLEFREVPNILGVAVTPVQSKELALEMGAAVLLEEGFTQRGDWNDAIEAKLMEYTGSEGRHAAESVLVQSLSMLTTRSQLWGIVVLAETRGPGGQVLSRRHQVVNIWKDPFLNPEGYRHGRYFSSTPFFEIR